jgi:RNA polymerase sigma factor (sigma-70 family)
MKSDWELLRAWCAGDKRAGSSLYRRHYRMVRCFLANKTGDNLEDLIQQTFEALLEGKDRFEGRGEFEAYLRGIARYKLYKYWESRRTRGSTTPIEEMSLSDLGAGPSTLLAREQEQRLLLEALRRVSLADQEILELFYWEAHTGPELAKKLGVAEPTARNRLRRARLNLAKEFRRLERFAGIPESTETQLDDWARNLYDRMTDSDKDGANEDLDPR